MHDWELLQRYSQYHPRWFETPARYEPRDEHRAVYFHVMPGSWSLERNGIWYVATQPEAGLPEQGWKLHVSSRTEDSTAVLRRALEVLQEHATCFKFLIDAHALACVNGKLWPRASGGKFITVYAVDRSHFELLGAHLAEALDGYAGPYILSDRRWPGSNCVFYRYGGFTPRAVLQLDGTRRLVIQSPDGTLVPDVRQPYWSAPEWIDDPLAPEDLPARTEIRLGDGRFEVTGAIRFSNRGGVYTAVDTQTGHAVVIKESRPHIEVGRHRIEAVALLEKEARLLSQLSETGHFVRPISFFREAEHAFLAEELISGEHIGRFTIMNNPLYHGRVTPAALAAYLGDMRSLWLQLARGLAAAHERGIVLGDLSFTNVLITPASEVRIIDLESAFAEGVDADVGLSTPGTTSPDTLESGVSDRANDLYALGAIIFGSIVLANGVSGFHPPAMRRFLEELGSDIRLPPELAGLIRGLMDSPSTHSAAAVVEAIQELPPAVPTLATATPRLALPALERLGAQPHELRARVGRVLDGLVDYLPGTADLTRDDRLVPADLMVFETNPLSVAFGAAGALYALRRLTGELPDGLLAWLLKHPVSGDAYPPGLYTGQAGVAWVLAELDCEEPAAALMRSARDHKLLYESPDVLCGAAGYGMAALKLWATGLGGEFLDDAVRVGAWILDTAVRDAAGARWPDAEGEIPIGYAYGGSGVALFLLYLHAATGDARALTVGREALSYELDQGIWRQGKFTGFPAMVVNATDDSEIVPRCYWDAGSAGVATTLARYLAVTGDESIREWVPRLAADISHKYAVMPQLFHGLAGMGNALVDIWEVTGDDRYLAEAWQVAEGVLLFGIERPEGVAMPGEQSLRESADFATGAAGVALFLDRLATAEPGSRTNFNFVVDELLPRTPLQSLAEVELRPLVAPTAGSTK
jgi:serine/threonine protein kinase